jgi:6-phosphogluconolactonase (cycloisomerase 2 family)
MTRPDGNASYCRPPSISRNRGRWGAWAWFVATAAIAAAIPGFAAAAPALIDPIGTLQAPTAWFLGSDLVLSPDGLYLYAGSAGFRRNPATGDLTFLEIGGVGAISPDGTKAVNGFSQIRSFTRDPATGKLTLADTDSVGGGLGSNVTGVAFSPEGEHVYVTFGDTLRAYAVSGSAELSLVEVETDDVGGVDGLYRSQAVAVSPDGLNVYVASFENALAVFSRDPGTGTLGFVEAERDGVGGVDGLGGARSVVVSPDGANVYATGAADDAVAVFARDPGTGALSFVEEKRNGVAGVSGLDEAGTVRISPDGAHLYVSSAWDDAIVVFARDPGTGTLDFVEAELFEPGPPLRFGDGPLTVAVSPDGAHVYAPVSYERMLIFDRDPVSGELTLARVRRFPGGFADVILSPADDYLYAAGSNAIAAFARDAGSGEPTHLQSLFDGEDGVDGLRGVRALAMSPGGEHVYAASAEDDAVAVFARNAGTGLLAFVEAERDGVGGVDGLDGARGVVVSPDGKHVYSVADGDDAVAAFARDPVLGTLTFVERETNGVGGVTGLDGAEDIAISPDGEHLYVASPATSAVAVFARDAGSGALDFVGAVDGPGPLGVGSAGYVVVSPDGAFVYVGEGAGDHGSVAAFARDAVSGALTHVETEVFGLDGVGGAAGPLAIDPQGEQLYDGSSIFLRDATSGKLVYVSTCCNSDS